MRKQKNPLGHPRGQRLLHGLGVDADPADDRARGQVRDLLLYRFVLCDLGVEDVELGVVAVGSVLFHKLGESSVEVVTPEVLVLIVRLLKRDAFRFVRQNHSLELGHAVKDVKVFLEFLHVVALADVQPSDKRSGVLESADPSVDQVANTRSFGIAALANLWRPLDVRYHELEADFQQRCLFRLGEDFGIDLLVEVLERREDGVCVAL